MSVAAVAIAAVTYFGLSTAFPQQGGKVFVARTIAAEQIFQSSLQAGGGGSSSAAVDDSAASAEMDVAASTYDGTDAEFESGNAAADAGYAMESTIDEADDSTSWESSQPVEPAPAPAAQLAAVPASAAQIPAAKPKPAAKLTQWWGTESDARLSIVYAGSAAYTRAIVLMFNGAFDDTESAVHNVRVADAAGKAVKGAWQIGANNKRMLLLPVNKTGTYTVTVSGGLTDRTGRTLGKTLSGPVLVQ